jgi:hypothetical protein
VAVSPVRQRHSSCLCTILTCATDCTPYHVDGCCAAGFFFRRGSASRSGSATPTASAPYFFARLSAGSGISSGAATPGVSAAGIAAAAAAAAVDASAGQQVLPRWQQQEQRWYYVLTYGLLTGMVMVAVAASNIWEVLSAVGDLASTIQVGNCFYLSLICYMSQSNTCGPLCWKQWFSARSLCYVFACLHSRYSRLDRIASCPSCHCTLARQ